MVLGAGAGREDDVAQARGLGGAADVLAAPQPCRRPRVEMIEHQDQRSDAVERRLEVASPVEAAGHEIGAETLQLLRVGRRLGLRHQSHRQASREKMPHGGAGRPVGPADDEHAPAGLCVVTGRHSDRLSSRPLSDHCSPHSPAAPRRARAPSGRGSA